MYLSDFVKYDENEENVFLVFVERERGWRESFIFEKMCICECSINIYNIICMFF